MSILSREMEKMDEQQKAKEEQEKKLKDFTYSFLNQHVSDDELAAIQKLVMNAAKNGAFEALVYSFPSDLCTDSGRAINSRMDHWPETLQGKAKELFDRYITNVKPQGFRLKATIINFPNGMPGDVGLFLSWAPEQV
ncbi:MAG: histidine kinase [Cereibacter sphaeroides]|uniref:Histidine kinase n=1 Tax=Cereibacter sphaeroides TaxID=1063 RepID=A0A2W5UCJ5_CERSP|nr:MAG: histidine kinase [Cereibacter sphaeroides]